MFKLYCEWSYGQETLIFTSETAARDWLEWRIKDDLEAMGFECFQDIFDEGFADIAPVTIIGAS